jgi:hypothetical protein
LKKKKKKKKKLNGTQQLLAHADEMSPEILSKYYK